MARLREKKISATLAYIILLYKTNIFLFNVTLMTMRIFKLDMSSILDNTIHLIHPVLSHHQIEDLTHLGSDLGSAASSHYASNLFFMPNLRSLNLDRVKLSDEFYSTMGSESSKSKVYQTRFLSETIVYKYFCTLQTQLLG